MKLFKEIMEVIILLLIVVGLGSAVLSIPTGRRVRDKYQADIIERGLGAYHNTNKSFYWIADSTHLEAKK